MSSVNIDDMSLPVSMVTRDDKDVLMFIKMNKLVMRRHQSLPPVLLSRKNNGPVRAPLTPQKMTSYFAAPQNRAAIPKFRRESTSPARPAGAGGQRSKSPPSPRKSSDGKENKKNKTQGPAKSVFKNGPSEKQNGFKPQPTKKDVPSKGQVKIKKEDESKNQTKLTSFFSVRRSERRPKLESEALQQKYIDDRLLADHDEDLGLEVRMIPEKGRGVFTTRDLTKGEFVVEYSGDLIDDKKAKELEGEYSMDLSKGCYMYYFKANNKQYCIDATKETGRLGRLVNHSRLVPNLHTKVVMFKGIPRLILVAKRDVKAGEELLYDYGDRSKQSLEAHPWLAL